MGRHARAAGLGRRDVLGVDRRQHARARRRPHRRRDGAAGSMPEAVRRAVHAAGAGREPAAGRARRRARLVDRAAAPRVLHARRRHRGVPGPGRRRPGGRGAAADRASPPRCCTRAGSRGCGARGAWRSDAATGLMLVGALALGVVLASDVFESGAGVDRLLFGSLIGLSDRDLWLTAGVLAAGSGARARSAARRGSRRASTRRRRARSASRPGGSPTRCCCWRSPPRRWWRSTRSARCSSPPCW